MKKATRGKDVRLRNREVWEAMLADRDVLVADVSSWVLGIADNGGILARLNNDEGRAAFGLDAVSVEGEDHFARMRRNFRETALYGVFPAGRSEGRRLPSQQDFINLRNRMTKDIAGELDASAICASTCSITTTREEVSTANATNLTFDATATVLKDLRDVVHALRLLADDTTQHCPSLDEPKGHGTARDSSTSWCSGGSTSPWRSGGRFPTRTRPTCGRSGTCTTRPCTASTMPGAALQSSSTSAF